VVFTRGTGSPNRGVGLKAPERLAGGPGKVSDTS